MINKGAEYWLDIGCGDCTVFDSIVSNNSNSSSSTGNDNGDANEVDIAMQVPLLKHIGGLEFNSDPLKKAKKKLSMKVGNETATKPLERISLWHGSILSHMISKEIELEHPKSFSENRNNNSVKRKSWEAISCIEVIEHLKKEG